MDTNKVINAILDAAKPMMPTPQSKQNFTKLCQSAGIPVDGELKLCGAVTEDSVEKLIDNLNTGVLKLVVRKVMRSF